MHVTSMSKPVRWWLSVMGSLLVPFVITTIFLAAAGRSGPSNGAGGILLPLSVFAGAACLFLSPLKETPKLVVGVAYVFLMAALQVGYALAFVCGVYGSCP